MTNTVLNVTNLMHIKEWVEVTSNRTKYARSQPGPEIASPDPGLADSYQPGAGPVDPQWQNKVGPASDTD